MGHPYGAVFVTGGPIIPFISSVTIADASVTGCSSCTGGGCDCKWSSYATVNNWDGATYRLAAWTRAAAGTPCSCTGTYYEASSDVTITTGTSDTLYLTVAPIDCGWKETGTTDCGQFEWRIYRRSDSALMSSFATSCGQFQCNICPC